MENIAESLKGAALHVQRPNTFTASGRKIEIWVDAKKVAKISNNQEIMIPITSGQHTIVAKMAPKFVSDEITVIVGDGEVQHLFLSPSQMKWEMVTNHQNFWLWIIPLVWLLHFNRAGVIAQGHFKIIYFTCSVAIFAFSFLLPKKKGETVPLFKCLRLEAVENKVFDDPKPMEFKGLIIILIHLSYVALPFLAFQLIPQHLVLSKSWFGFTGTIYCLLGYLITGALYKRIAYKPGQNLSEET